MSKFSFSKRIKSFKYAFKGIYALIRHEHNAWIHLSIALTTMAGGFYLNISNLEWTIILLTIGIVLAAEAFNTAIEQMANYVQPLQDRKIEIIKDLSAGGVLITAIAASAVGLVIFLPKIIQLISTSTL